MKRLGLIGFPLSHSFSQKYFTDKFKKEGIPGHTYQLFPLHFISELPLLLSAYPDLIGLNVTIPYKEQVIPFMDHLDESAREAGAVNTIRIHRLPDGSYTLTGYNTDVFGFRESIRPILRNNHQRALILGTGGAAKAIASVLRSLNIDYLFVSRKEGAARTITYSELNAQAVHNFPFIINCTPLGMYPHTEGSAAIPYAFLNEKNFLYDLVYNPEETVFMRKGRERGALVKNGLDMLHLQADKAWEIFNAR